jgi:UrcA family protein
MSTTIRSRALGLSLAAVLLAAPAPLLAAESFGNPTESLRLAGIDRAPDSGAEVRVVKRRLSAAALDVCGASSGSLRTVKRGVARSECYRQAYADAAAQIRWPSDQRDSQVAPN